MRSSLKRAVRRVIAAPGVRHGLRWFLHQPAVPVSWRDVAHRKVAKRARFGDHAFSFTTADGVRLQLLHTGTSNYLYWLGEYEPETTNVFCTLARRAEVVLDIGAADGIYAILAAACSPARILAFEPGPAAALVARRNIALNSNLIGRIELHAFALGERDDVATLYVAGESGGTSSLNPSFRQSRTEEQVTVRNGDAFLREAGVARVDLIKIDTESTEPAVLRGMRATLQRDRPDVICEVLSGRTEHELEAIVREHGYAMYWMTDGGLVRHDRIVGDKTYRAPNYLFTHKHDDDLRALGVALG